MAYTYQLCRVCYIEIAAAETNDYSVHPECMDTYQREALAEINRLRPRMNVRRAD